MLYKLIFLKQTLTGKYFIVKIPGALKANVPAHKYSKLEVTGLRLGGWEHSSLVVGDSMPVRKVSMMFALHGLDISERSLFLDETCHLSADSPTEENLWVLNNSSSNTVFNYFIVF